MVYNHNLMKVYVECDYTHLNHNLLISQKQKKKWSPKVERSRGWEVSWPWEASGEVSWPWERQGEVSSPGVSAATGRASREREKTAVVRRGALFLSFGYGAGCNSSSHGGSQEKRWRMCGLLSSNLFSFLFLMRACLCGMCTDFTETVLLLYTGSERLVIVSSGIQ